MADGEHFGLEQQYQAPRRSIWDGDWMSQAKPSSDELESSDVATALTEKDEITQPNLDWS